MSAAGGALYGENATSGPGGTSILTLKVPPGSFRATLDRLVALGTKLGETITTDDVTQQVTDVNTRVATLRDSIARVQALFDRAGTVVEVAQLDSDLAQRQAELESLLAQQRNLEAQVDLSTITLTLTRTAPPPPKPRHAAAKGFTDGLHGGWHALGRDRPRGVARRGRGPAVPAPARAGCGGRPVGHAATVAQPAKRRLTSAAISAARSSMGRAPSKVTQRSACSAACLRKPSATARWNSSPASSRRSRPPPWRATR